MSEKLANLAREVETDPDKKAWDGRLRKIAAAKPALKPEGPK